MNGFRFGRLLGIELRIDWSWVFIFVLMTWNLSVVFAAWHPSWEPTMRLGVAVAGSLLFFACILLHELMHALVAKAFGQRVQSITLFLFGGVTNIEREPPSPSAEFLTAMVGPITSILLGVGALALAASTTPVPLQSAQGTWRAVSHLGPLSTLLVWLGPINIVIGLFNSIPAFPLDGGRMLRALLWGLSQRLDRATRWASAIGQAVGWALVTLGVAMSFGLHVPWLGTGLLNGLWLAFIGWFLSAAAVHERNRLAIDEALGGRRVEQVMRRSGPAVTPEATLAEVVREAFVRNEERALPVLDGEHLLGIVTLTDLRRIPPEAWPVTRVTSVMRPAAELVSTRPDEALVQAFTKLAENDVDQLPVLDNGRLVGMLNRRDITRWIELVWRPQDHGGRAALRTSGGHSTGPFSASAPHGTPGR